MGESLFLDKYWKFSTINSQDPLKISNFFVKNALLISLKKTHQIYTNLQNWLDLCQKNWNQSEYWKLSPMGGIDFTSFYDIFYLIIELFRQCSAFWFFYFI